MGMDAISGSLVYLFRMVAQGWGSALNLGLGVS